MNKGNCDQLRRLISEHTGRGGVLLDVRSPEEFQRGALPEATNIPLPLLPVLADERLRREDPVLIYCHSGARAVMAQKILQGMGYGEVINIGGLEHIRRCH